MACRLTVKDLMIRRQLSYVKIGTPTRFHPADLLDELQGLILRHWVHTLEYRGHWLTRSRTWSTTYTELRVVRQRWRLDKLSITPEQAALRFGEWEYRGIGYQAAGDAWLANSANASAKRARPVTWEEP